MNNNNNNNDNAPPALTFQKYEELLGGPFPEPVDTEPETLSCEAVISDGIAYKREEVRLRVLSDEDAHQYHPELAAYGSALDKAEAAFEWLDAGSANSLTDQTYRNFYQSAAFLIEGFTMPDDPYARESLKQIYDIIKQQYAQTLSMYTHTNAYVLSPLDAGPQTPKPAILALHQHNAEYGVGKAEPAGLGGNPKHATAVDLVKQGYVVICPDQLGFETRQHPVRTDQQWERWRNSGLSGHGQSLLQLYLSDAQQVLDYLESRPDVSPDHIGVYGHSLGSWVAVNLAQIDERVKSVVGNCGFPTAEGMNRYPGQFHCEPHIIPGIAAYGDTPAILGIRDDLTIHLNFGEWDVLNSGFAKVIAAGEQLAWGRFSSYVAPECQHDITPEMLAATLEKFDYSLKQPTPATYLQQAFGPSDP